MSGIPEGEAGAALRALLTDSVVGLAVWDTGLRCVWVNDALERYDGIARERRLGRRPRESLTGDTGELEALVRRVLAPAGVSPAASTGFRRRRTAAATAPSRPPSCACTTTAATSSVCAC
ncbi:hypothetical protein GCM10010095_43810 [Streptomyces anthocyanicus]|uniref:PAS domain-containing protein n=1 Tax=Streptomyces anthocyanicus TaxID=68174 RepID=UPI0019C6BFC5|nr:PAS domain-containing protein [Streptomyces anthocyanicus]GGL54116.1 hypothetical protein GCM10010095_43810 [Streptomyces anthocyanicus]